MIFATAAFVQDFALHVLWIAFVPWNYDICNSKCSICNEWADVVNCFCSLKLWYLQQPRAENLCWPYGCELLLFLEIMIFATAMILRATSQEKLWIAFVPWNYDICNSNIWNFQVICRLWIAFVPWNYDICNSPVVAHGCRKYVVNCFCSLKLWYLQQLRPSLFSLFSCCELLLFLEIMIFATAIEINRAFNCALWIAFVPWNYDICNSITMFFRRSLRVVNCFCSLKLWYLQQPS